MTKVGSLGWYDRVLGDVLLRDKIVFSAVYLNIEIVGPKQWMFGFIGHWYNDLVY